MLALPTKSNPAPQQPKYQPSVPVPKPKSNNVASVPGTVFSEWIHDDPNAHQIQSNPHDIFMQMTEKFDEESTMPTLTWCEYFMSGDVCTRRTIRRSLAPSRSESSSRSTTLVRRRRGLLDFVGVTHKFLYGSATEADVQECQDSITSLRNGVRDSNNKLISVVNAQSATINASMSVLNETIQNWIAYSQFVPLTSPPTPLMFPTSGTRITTAIVIPRMRKTGIAILPGPSLSSVDASYRIRR